MKTNGALWKAVPIAGENASNSSEPFYLRNGLSFSTLKENGHSLLAGSIDAVPLDLSYHAGDTRLIWNPDDTQNSTLGVYPVGTYQPQPAHLYRTQWSYVSPGVLIADNLDPHQWGLLEASVPKTELVSVDERPDGVASEFPATQRWYAWPNYSMAYLLSMPSPNGVPFPEYAPGTGERAAYDYISNSAGAADKACEIGTEPDTPRHYTGIRCIYTDAAPQTFLESCIDATFDDSLRRPIKYNGIAISRTQWNHVADQLYIECTAVAHTYDMFFDVYEDIVEDLHDQNQDIIEALMGDLAASDAEPGDETRTFASPLEIFEKMLILALKEASQWTGGTIKHGVTTSANFLSAALVRTLTPDAGSKREAMLSPIEAAASQLHKDLGERMLDLQRQVAESYTDIVASAERLTTYYEMSKSYGFGGLGIQADDKTKIVQQLANGYRLSVMQQLLPLVYGVAQYAAVPSQNPEPAQIPDSVNPAAKYSSPMMPTAGNIRNQFYLSSIRTVGNTPTDTIMYDDLYDLGADAFEIFYGLNGWASIEPVGSANPDFDNQTNLGCAGEVVAILNQTDTEFLVDMQSQSGVNVAVQGPHAFNMNPNLGDLQGTSDGTHYPLVLQPYSYAVGYYTSLDIKPDFGDEDVEGGLPIVFFSDARQKGQVHYSFDVTNCRLLRSMKYYDFDWSDDFVFTARGNHLLIAQETKSDLVATGVPTNLVRESHIPGDGHGVYSGPTAARVNEATYLFWTGPYGIVQALLNDDWTVAYIKTLGKLAMAAPTVVQADNRIVMLRLGMERGPDGEGFPLYADTFDLNWNLLYTQQVPGAYPVSRVTAAYFPWERRLLVTWTDNAGFMHSSFRYDSNGGWSSSWQGPGGAVAFPPTYFSVGEDEWFLAKVDRDTKNIWISHITPSGSYDANWVLRDSYADGSVGAAASTDHVRLAYESADGYMAVIDGNLAYSPDTSNWQLDWKNPYQSKYRLEQGRDGVPAVIDNGTGIILPRE